MASCDIDIHLEGDLRKYVIAVIHSECMIWKDNNTEYLANIRRNGPEAMTMSVLRKMAHKLSSTAFSVYTILYSMAMLVPCPMCEVFVN